MNISWFLFSTIAVVLFGFSTSFYKLPGFKGQSKAAVTFWLLVLLELLSLFFFWDHLSVPSLQVLLFSMLWSAGFVFITTLQIYALERVETNTLFPTTTTLSLTLSILLGTFIFNENPTVIQWLGIGLAIVAVYLFLYKKGKVQYSRYVLWIGSGVIFLSVFNKLIQKFAVDAVNIFEYQIWQYFFGALLAFVMVIYLDRRKWHRSIFSGSFSSGLIISIPAFFGTWSLLIALTIGPFSLITAMHSMYVFVAALVGYLIFKERLTTKKVLLICLAIVAIFLIRLGGM